MAFSSTVAWKSVFGDKRVTCLSMVADGANGDTSTSGVAGIGYVFSAHISPVSMATAAPDVKINKTNAGATSNGNVSISSVASGDVFYLTVYGR